MSVYDALAEHLNREYEIPFESVMGVDVKRPKDKDPYVILQLQTRSDSKFKTATIKGDYEAVELASKYKDKENLKNSILLVQGLFGGSKYSKQNLQKMNIPELQKTLHVLHSRYGNGEKAGSINPYILDRLARKFPNLPIEYLSSAMEKFDPLDLLSNGETESLLKEELYNNLEIVEEKDPLDEIEWFDPLDKLLMESYDEDVRVLKRFGLWPLK